MDILKLSIVSIIFILIVVNVYAYEPFNEELKEFVYELIENIEINVEVQTINDTKYYHIEPSITGEYEYKTTIDGKEGMWKEVKNE